MESRSDQPKKSNILYIASAAIGSVVEQVTYSLDTAIRRVQADIDKFAAKQGPSLSFYKRAKNKIGIFKQVAFSDSFNGTFAAKFHSLHKGFFLGAAYKFTRIYKYAAQKYAVDEFDALYGQQFKNKVGDHKANILRDATIGGAISVSEIPLFYWWDTIMAKRQTNDPRTLWQMIRSEKLRLYNGAPAALVRNVPGSFALFGTNAAVMAALGIQNPKDATFGQYVLSSLTAATTAAAATNPMAVIKTRMQTTKEKISTVSMFNKVLTEEGLHALVLRGLSLRVIQSWQKFAIPLVAIGYLPQVLEKLHVQSQQKNESVNDNRAGKRPK